MSSCCTSRGGPAASARGQAAGKRPDVGPDDRDGNDDQERDSEDERRPAGERQAERFVGRGVEAEDDRADPDRDDGEDRPGEVAARLRADLLELAAA